MKTTLFGRSVIKAQIKSQIESAGFTTQEQASRLALIEDVEDLEAKLASSKKTIVSWMEACGELSNKIHWQEMLLKKAIPHVRDDSWEDKSVSAAVWVETYEKGFKQ